MRRRARLVFAQGAVSDHSKVANVMRIRIAQVWRWPRRKFVVVAKVRLVCPEATLSRTVPEAVADTEGRGFAMSGAVSQLIGHLWGEVVKHGPTVRPLRAPTPRASLPQPGTLDFNDGPSRFADLHSPFRLSGASPGMPG